MVWKSLNANGWGVIKQVVGSQGAGAHPQNLPTLARSGAHVHIQVQNTDIGYTNSKIKYRYKLQYRTILGAAIKYEESPFHGHSISQLSRDTGVYLSTSL